MRAMTVIPGQADSADLTDLPEPEPKEGELLVEPLFLGVCGTDREILDGAHGEPPPGHERIVLGHELLGRVKQGGGGIEEGRPVAGMLRPPPPRAPPLPRPRGGGKSRAQPDTQPAIQRPHRTPPPPSTILPGI